MEEIRTSRELQLTDTALDTESLHSTTELLRTVLDGSDKLIQKLSSSSSDMKVTTIAHHAHKATLDIQQQELVTRTPRSTSTESSLGNHQSSHGANCTRELHTTDTAKDTSITL
jgi:hypothetical protein